MATEAVKQQDGSYTAEVFVYKWVLTAGETGDAIAVPGRPDKTVQLFGTFGAGAVTIEGSLQQVNPAQFATVRDHQGDPVSATADDIVSIQENAYFIRPVASAGITSVTVLLMVR